MLGQILIASLIGSVFALTGGTILLYREKLARRVSLFLVSFAVGSLLSAAFFELLPEALKLGEPKFIFGAAVFGLVVFFLFEKFLRWYHCHDDNCETHIFSSTVIAGDTFHNLLDGVAIAAGFLSGGPVGIITTLAVFFHEVPQEIGDFGILLHAGYSRSKVFLYNFISALATPVGAVAAYFFLPTIQGARGYVMAFTAGVFIYIAASDLIPEVQHKSKPREFGHVLMMILGLLTVLGLGIILPE